MTRDGASLQADGKVGLLRVEYRPWAHEWDINHVLKPGQDGADRAKSLSISDLAMAPKLILNGRPADIRADGQTFRISLA